MRLVERCTKATIAERRSTIAVISFNYDRTFEHFLLESLQNYWRFTAAEAAEILESLAIYHPYGLVGYLPWMEKHPVAEFGKETEQADKLLAYAQGIKTFTEKFDDAEEIAAIKRCVFDATRIVFLGFEFHEDNMRLLRTAKSRGPEYPSTDYYATALGISDNDRHDVVTALHKMKPEAVTMDDGRYRIDNRKTCSGLFDEYWRSLSLSERD